MSGDREAVARIVALAVDAACADPEKDLFKRGQTRARLKHEATDQILAALRVDGGGSVTVPREPTSEMVGAALALPGPCGAALVEAIYRAMIEAAPSVSSPSKGGA